MQKKMEPLAHEQVLSELVQRESENYAKYAGSQTNQS